MSALPRHVTTYSLSRIPAPPPPRSRWRYVGYTLLILAAFIATLAFAAICDAFLIDNTNGIRLTF